MQIPDPNGPIVDPDTGQHWRLLDVRADLDRIPRQQDFIRKLAGVAIAKSLSDPFLAIQIADNVLGDIKADQALTRDDVNALIRAFKTVDVNDQNSVRFETLPTVPDPSNPNVDARARARRRRPRSTNSARSATTRRRRRAWCRRR